MGMVRKYGPMESVIKANGMKMKSTVLVITSIRTVSSMKDNLPIT